MVVVVRDVFHTLFHPIGHGSIAPQVMKLVWRLLRLFPSDRRIASLTGPLGITAVIITWGVTAVLGWILIYFPQMPNAVSYSSELNPAARNELIDSLYLSLVTVATLGFGDIVPTSPWLRVAAPLEALFGFMLVTAAVSWVLQIYPALHRRRVLDPAFHPAPGAPVGHQSGGGRQHPNRRAYHGGRQHRRGPQRLHPVRRHILLSRYFRDLEAVASLAASLEYATDLAAEATASTQSQVRLAGAMITAAVDSLAELLDQEFLHLGGDTFAVVQAYAADHGHKP